MCHRRLWFNKHTPCGHITFTTGQDIDCGQPTCHNSAAHPSSCLPPACRCRRYFTQPERLISQELPAKCTRCATSSTS